MQSSAAAKRRGILSALSKSALARARGRTGVVTSATPATVGSCTVACFMTVWFMTAVAAAEPGTAAPAAVEIESPAARPPSPQEAMTARGFVRHRGTWRTTQEIELIERAERANVAQKEWNARLERLRRRLDQPAQAEAAAEEIREISDGFAVPALAAALAAEPQPRVRALYLEALTRIRVPEAAQTLIAVALDHADPETRILAVERLAAIDAAGAAAAILPALGGGDNGRINRAAAALGRLGSRSAVGPLIEVLETEHVVTADGPPEGSTTATFTPSGGGLALGGGPKRRKVRVHNEQVLEALVALTGVNFDWSVEAWKAWLASRQCPPDFDPRRG